MRAYLPAGLLCCLCILSGASNSSDVRINVRTRVEAFRGSGEKQPASFEYTLPLSRTALIICDMWDHHWCDSASQRVDALAHKMQPVIDLLRQHGVLIIHAPSETMSFYKDNPARLAILAFPKIQTPEPLTLTESPLPIDDSDGGCDNPNNSLKPNTRVWTRENSAIRVLDTDLVSDDGHEIYNALHAKGIQTLLYAGVHANMCILNRTFGIRQMAKWGMRAILIRDLTDAMYNPASRPFVSHQRGTEMVIEHIEANWAPTVTSDDLVSALRQVSK